MNARTALARGVASLRKARGWTQAELAEAADLSVRFVSAIEQQARVPSIENLEAICGAFGVSASELFAAGEDARSKRPPGSDLLRSAAPLLPQHEAAVQELLGTVARMIRNDRKDRATSSSGKRRK